MDISTSEDQGTSNLDITSNPEAERPSLRTAINKLVRRCNSGKRGDVVVLDIDGTVYNQTKTPDGKWVKKGDNSELSDKITGENIPLVLISGRVDWGAEGDEEMATYNLTKADVIAAGAGSIIYWRGEDGQLHLDTDYLENLKRTKVIGRLTKDQFDGLPMDEQSHYSASENGVNGNNVAYTREIGEYDPEQLVPTLSTLISGIEGTRVKIDRNKGLDFTVIDLNKVSLDQLKRMLFTLRNGLKGVTIEFSEDLKDLSGDYFTGWMQVLPSGGGKDGALRWITNRMMDEVEVKVSKDKTNISAHVIGDATIDIWMLATGSTGDTSGRIRFIQYRLSLLTPYAASKLKPVMESLHSSGMILKSSSDLIQLTQTGPEGVISAVRRL